MFVELKARTNGSFLRGASHPKELFEQAKDLGMPSLGIVDRNGMYGIPRAYQAAQETGVRLIVGAELSLGFRPGPATQVLTLLAKTRAAYGLICRLLTEAFRDQEKDHACLEWEAFFALLAGHANAAQDLFFLCGADDSGLSAWVNAERSEERWLQFCERYGRQSYWLECRFLDGRDEFRKSTAQRAQSRFGLLRIASNDVLYHAASRRELHDTLTATRFNLPLSECGFRLLPNAERRLKSAAEMAKLFRNDLQLLSRTEEIAAECAFSPKELRYYYPSEWIPAGETAQSYLERLTWEGARERYGGAVPAAVENQLAHELKLVGELKYSDYFLTIWDIVKFAEGKKILCQGRGSAANSVICYCLKITAIDPVRMNLLFERFISGERNEPPDIDVDFEHERREEVIQYIYDKYGRDRAAMVAAVITYRSRSIARDVNRALGREPASEEEMEGEKSADPLVQKIFDELRGFPRHLSIHSGGFTLSAEPIIEIVPVEPARMDGRTVIQWDKEDLAIIGLLKVDILALGMLTAIRKTLDLAQPKSPGLGFATIPGEDAPTYAMIQRAETVGVFQIESRAQMGMLGRLLPKTYYDLVIQVAIVRPGPIVGQMVHPFLRRRRGEEPADVPDPRLLPILSRTLGVPLFQEQVMRIAMSLAGFTPGEADQLRRAIGAWRSAGTIEKMGQKLKDGLLANGLPLDFVERVFMQVRGFSEYGFPESHAASFALIAYASAFLKCHYPAEFACALINSQPMGFYSIHTLIEEVKRRGVRVLPVHLNRSDWDCALEPWKSSEGIVRRDRLRLGLRVVRGLSEKEAKLLLRERGARPFQSLSDFLGRTHLRTEVLYALALGDAFVCFGLTPREALWQLLAHLQWKAGERESARAGQLSLFPTHAPRVTRDFGSVEMLEQIRSEYRSFRCSTKGHPLWAMRQSPQWREFLPSMNSAEIKQSPPDANCVAAGLVIVRQRPSTAKGTCFATLEDEAGFLDLILHQKVFLRFENVFKQSPFLLVYGRLQRDTHTVNLIVTRLKPLGIDSLRVQSRDFR